MVRRKGDAFRRDIAIRSQQWERSLKGGNTMADLGRILGFAEVVTPTTGGLNTTGSVTLSSAAPAGGTVVNLTSSNTSVATVPASTTVAAGQTKSPSFTITTFVVSAQTQVTISGN